MKTNYSATTECVKTSSIEQRCVLSNVRYARMGKGFESGSCGGAGSGGGGVSGDYGG